MTLFAHIVHKHISYNHVSQYHPDEDGSLLSLVPLRVTSSCHLRVLLLVNAITGLLIRDTFIDSYV